MKTLPQYYCFQYDGSEKAKKVLDWFNNKYDAGWGGGYRYYGFTDTTRNMGTDATDDIKDFRNNPTFISLDDMLDHINGGERKIKGWEVLKDCWGINGGLCMKGMFLPYNSLGSLTYFQATGLINNPEYFKPVYEEEKIEIGGYEVKFEHGATTISGYYFTKEFWEAAKIISQHSFAKVMVGCSKQFDVSLETIEKILDRLNK